jgi:hypothetical protein
MSRRSRTVPRPCLSESDFSRLRHSAAWEWHGSGMGAAWARHGRGMGMAWHMWISIGRPEKECGQPGRVLLLPATTRSSTKVVIRSIPFCWTVGLAVRIFPATTLTFTKETALSENDRGAVWHVWINVARHGRGTTWEPHGCGMGAAGARHGMCELAFSLPRESFTGQKLTNDLKTLVQIACCTAKYFASFLRNACL